MFVIDYGDKLPRGTIVTFAKITVEVSSGVDELPQRVFSQVWDIDGTKVTFQVRQGLPGVIYTLKTAVAFADTWLYRDMKLAVLPDFGDVGALYPLTRVFTSQPYPQEFIESVTTSAYMGMVLLEDLVKLGDVAADRELNAIWLSGGVLNESLGNIIEDNETNQIALTGGVLQEPPTGNFTDNEQDHIVLTGGVLAVVPTGYPQDNNETNHIALTGGELKVP